MYYVSIYIYIYIYMCSVPTPLASGFALACGMAESWLPMFFKALQFEIPAKFW